MIAEKSIVYHRNGCSPHQDKYPQIVEFVIACGVLAAVVPQDVEPLKLSKARILTCIAMDLHGRERKADCNSETVNIYDNQVVLSSIWLRLECMLVKVDWEDCENDRTDQV